MITTSSIAATSTAALIAGQAASGTDGAGRADPSAPALAPPSAGGSGTLSDGSEVAMARPPLRVLGAVGASTSMVAPAAMASTWSAAARPAARVAAALAALRAHLEVAGDDLVACSVWLGDERWRLLAASFVTAVAKVETPAGLGRWRRGLLVSLHRLLSLDLANDADEGGVGWFATIDLSDERVMRCCRHSEVLGELRAALDAADVARRRSARRVHLLAA